DGVVASGGGVFQRDLSLGVFVLEILGKAGGELEIDAGRFTAGGDGVAESDELERPAGLEFGDGFGEKRGLIGRVDEDRRDGAIIVEPGEEFGVAVAGELALVEI